MPAYSIGGADGWTLTDLFENIYLRQAGPDKYDQLADARDQVDRPVGQDGADDDGAGPRRHAATSPAARPARCRPTSRPRSTNVFADAAEGGAGDRGRLRPRRRRVARRSSSRRPATTCSRSRRSAARRRRGRRRRRLDRRCSRTRRPSQALIKYLASPEAATIWAKRGGFSSPNKNVDATPTRTTSRGTTATAIAQGGDVPLRHVRPRSRPRSAARPGQGEWKILQDFLANPTTSTAPAQSSRPRPRRRSSRRR